MNYQIRLGGMNTTIVGNAFTVMVDGEALASSTSQCVKNDCGVNIQGASFHVMTTEEAKTMQLVNISKLSMPICMLSMMIMEIS